MRTSRLACLVMVLLATCATWTSAQQTPANVPVREDVGATALNFVTLAHPTLLAWPKDAPAPKAPLMPLRTDWDGDGKMDLLVADGDGKLWLLHVAPENQSIALKSAETIKAGGNEIALGKTFQPNYVDMDGDGLPDLVAPRDKSVLVFRNVGTREKPEFDTWTFAGSYKTPLALPDSTGPRLEVADWDRNGLPDLIAGTWQGEVLIFLNHGTKQLAVYERAVHATVDNKPLKKAYICSLRLLDVTKDGSADLVLAMNQSYILVYENGTKLSMPLLRQGVKILDSSGGPFEAQKQTDIKHVYPTIGDMDGDGIADVLFGNDSNKLYLARGIKR